MVNIDTLYVSTPLVKIEGATSEQMQAFMRDILQISVEESLHLPGMFTIVVNNPYAPLDSETQTWKHEPLIQIGKSVQIGFISSTTEAEDSDDPYQDYIIDGEITAIETHFASNTQAPIVIRGYDVAHRLHRGRYIRSFQNYTDADIVEEIANEIGLEIGTLEASGEPHEYVFQENQTNMEFLRERAARIGFELFVQGNQLFFRKPQASDTLKLKWLHDISSFRVRVTSAEQVSTVEVRSWDYSKKEPIVSTIEKDQVITTTDNGKGRDNSNKFGRNAPAPKMIVVDKPVLTPKQADVMAQALFDELAGEFVYADAQAPGDPRLRVGKIVELEGMGRYSGKYYITETRHLFYQGIYTTEFSVRGLRGGDLFQTLSPTTRLKPGQTHLVGIVTDNKDPKGWGRVRVKFPTLTPQKDSTAHASYWARIVGVGAGNGRGFDCLPEINDEVLVAFEHGDIHRPYVIGNVWNGKDSPPEPVENVVTDKGKVRLRTFKTRTGHSLQFVEEDKDASRTGIYVQTAAGHKIRLNDTDGSIEIETASKQRIRLDDRNSNLTIQSSGNINLQAGSGQVFVSDNVICKKVLTGTLLIGTQIETAVDVGQTLTNLQTQLQQNTEADRQREQTLNNVNKQLQQNTQEDRQREQAIADLKNQMQQNTAADRQRDENLAKLQNQLQPNNNKPQPVPATTAQTNNPPSQSATNQRPGNPPNP